MEDDADDAALSLLALKEANPERRVERAADGVQCLQYLRSCCDAKRDLPALILLDLKLPYLGGLEVLHSIRNDPRLRPLNVVAMTSSAEERDEAEARRLGVLRYVQKPADLDAFFSAMRDIERLVPRD